MPFIKLDHEVLERTRELTAKQFRVLILLLQKFNGKNNGDLHLTIKEAAEYDIGKRALYESMKVLVAKNFIRLAEVKHVNNNMQCGLYALRHLDNPFDTPIIATMKRRSSKPTRPFIATMNGRSSLRASTVHRSDEPLIHEEVDKRVNEDRSKKDATNELIEPRAKPFVNLFRKPDGTSYTLADLKPHEVE